MIKKRYIFSAMLASLLLTLVFVAGCDKRGGGQNRLIVGQDIGAVMSLDPGELYELVGSELVFNVYDRPFVRENDQLKPSLVSDFSYDEKRRVVRCEIHKNRVFSSGNPVTAEDVVFSLQRVFLMGKTAVCMLNPLGITRETARQSIRYVNTYTFEMELSKHLNMDLIKSCLASSAASVVDSKLAKSHAQGDDLGNTWLRSNCAGGGPLMLGEWRPGEFFTLKKNLNYTGSSVVKFTSVVVRHISDVSAQMIMLRKGEIDLARNLSADYLKELDPKQYNIETVDAGAVYYLNLNQRNEILKRPKVVKALRHLIDREAICIALGRITHEPLSTILPPCFFGAASLQDCPFDPKKAKALIEEELGKDAEVELDIEVENLAVAQILQTNFALAGVKLKFITMMVSELLHDCVLGNTLLRRLKFTQTMVTLKH